MDKKEEEEEEVYDDELIVGECLRVGEEAAEKVLFLMSVKMRTKLMWKKQVILQM